MTKKPIDSAKEVEAEAAKKAQEEAAAKTAQETAQQTAQQTGKPETTDKAQTKQAENNVDPTKSQTADETAQTPSESAQTKEAKEAEAKASIKEKITEKAPFLGKVVDFVADSWEQTFPSETYHIKAEQARRKAKEQIEKETVKKEYTEEELGQIQENIPDWKRTAMETYVEDTESSTGIKDRVAGAIKEKFNQTEAARKLYASEQYKEYESFKKEMGQFQEDLKDHLSQSQNPAVIASMAVYNKATSESNTAMAIKEMRKYIKNFDVFDLERDARGIFCDVYNSFLNGDLTYIEKTCMDAALAYFKTLLKKREVEGVHPKYTHLWESEPAEFVGGRISERNTPCFTYSIRIQEIHCNISNKTGKVVDGAGDRLLQNRYNFVLSLHETPEVHTVGHMWAIVEIIPLEAVPLLA